jgi:hypothetical protein
LHDFLFLGPTEFFVQFPSTILEIFSFYFFFSFQERHPSAFMPHTLPHSSLQLLSRGDALQTRTLPQGTTKKQQLKEPLKQHHEKHMDAEQDSEGAQRHTDGAESKWHMVLEKEANMQALDEQISEIHAAEYRAQDSNQQYHRIGARSS